MEWIELQEAARIWGVGPQGALYCVEQYGMRSELRDVKGKSGGPRRFIHPDDVAAETNRRIKAHQNSLNILRAAAARFAKNNAVTA